MPAYIRPVSAAALPVGGALGRPGGHRHGSRALMELFPQDESLHRWLRMAAGGRVPKLPARICWLGLGERHRAGLLFNRWWPMAA